MPDVTYYQNRINSDNNEIWNLNLKNRRLHEQKTESQQKLKKILKQIDDHQALQNELSETEGNISSCLSGISNALSAISSWSGNLSATWIGSIGNQEGNAEGIIGLIKSVQERSITEKEKLIRKRQDEEDLIRKYDLEIQENQREIHNLNDDISWCYSMIQSLS